MSKFTFYNSLESQSKKMKRWARLLILFTLLGLAQNSYPIELDDIVAVSEDSNYCEAFTTLVGNSDITSFITTGGITNISNDTGLNSSPNGYGDFTNLSMSHFETGEISFTITTNNFSWSSGVNIWVDWNNDKVFEESEKVSSTGFGNNSFIGTFSVPIGIPTGNYRIRIRGDNFTANPMPCGTIFTGETEDYTFTVIPPPSCISPSQLDANIISSTSVELFWTSEGTNFEVQYGLEDFNLGEGIIVTDITNTYTILLNLEPVTYYHYYVRKKCNENEFSTWAGPYLLYIIDYCEALTTLVGNSNITSFITADGITNISNDTGFNSSPNGYGDFTNLSVSHFETGEVSFTITTNNFSWSSGVNIWVDWNSNMAFEESEKISSTNLGNNSFTGTFSIPFGTPAGNYRIRIRGDNFTANPTPCGTIFSGETEDYTFTVISSPSCISPSQLDANIISSTSAELIWVSAGTNFEVQYGLEDFNLGEGTIMTDIANTSIILVDLEPVIYYHYYVRKECSENEFSAWAGPYLFYIDYCEAFSTGTGNYITSFTTTGGILYNIENITGNSSNPNGYGNYTGMSVHHFETGTIDFTVATNNNLAVNIWVDWNNNMVFEESEKIAAFSSPGFGAQTYSGSFSVPLGTPVGDYRIRIRGESQLFNPNADLLPCGTINSGETEDYTFTVITPSNCTSPNLLGFNIISLTSGELFWTSEGTNFEVQYGLQNFSLGEGITIADITDTSTVLLDLDPDTHYHYYVRKECSEGGFSYWAGPYLFYMNYCEAFSSETGSSITSFVTTGGITNISNDSGSVSSPNGYGNFTNMAVSHFHTGEISFILTSNEWFSINIWVDWNNNMMFEESEKMYTVPFAQFVDSFTGNFSVPFNTPLGNYRMRIRGLYGESNPSPCGNMSLGETEDYTFTVVSPPSCLPPFVPTSTNISTTSTLLEWQADGDLFDIEYGLEGFIPGSGTTITEVPNPYTLSGLTVSQTYQYYVRQDCGVDDGVSDWTGPFTFTAGVYNANIPSSLNLNPTVEDEACAASFSIEVPDGQYLSALNVQYTMISIPMHMAQVAQQRSALYSPTLEMGEPEVAVGDPGYNYPGTYNYNRNVDFANGATGTIEFVLKAWRTEGGTGCNTDYIFVQDGTWILTPSFEYIPTCPIPTDLGIANITESSIDLIWSSEEGILFDVSWGAEGFDPEDGEGVLISDIESTSYGVSDLDSSVFYEFYVRNNCSTDDENLSEWAGPFRFNAGYCIPTSELNRYISLFSTSSALDNITYTASGLPSGSLYGYRDHTNNADLFISQEAGASFDFTTTYIGGSSGTRIWVDWNNNFVFDDEEEVFYEGGAGTKTGTITIPEDIIPGNYVMRIRSQDGASFIPSACGQVSAGEAIDFTLNVTCFIAPPEGETNQEFTQGQTLADLDVTGVGLTWYANEDLTTVLEETEELVHQTTYYVVNTNEYCLSEALVITVTDICFGFAAPVGDTVQQFTQGQTLAGLDVTGVGLTWYADAELTQMLESTHELVHGTTYYVVTTNDNCQSEALTITVEELVSTVDFERYEFRYYPNPVSEVLYLTSNTTISDLIVLNMLGQQLNLPVDSQNTQVDMTSLPSGNYFICITIEGINKIFKVVKH